MSIIDQVQGETQSVLRCDVCGATETGTGKPFDSRLLALHRSLAHNIRGRFYDNSQRYAAAARRKRGTNAKAEELTCDVCGVTQTGNGKPFTVQTLARHKSQSHRKSAAMEHVPAKRNGRIINGDVGTLDVALAVLGKVSPDGRIAVSDLPEVLDWITQTHTIIERVSAR